MRKPDMLQMLHENPITCADAHNRRQPSRPVAALGPMTGESGVSDGGQGQDGEPAHTDASGAWADDLRRIALHADEVAFTRIFSHFAPRVKAFLMKSGTDAAMAEECMQDVMATVWTKAAQFDPGRASVSTWVYTIARNRRIDLLRKSRRPEPEDLPWGPEPEPDQVDALGLQQETRLLGAALASLPGAQRELIEQAYFGDLSHGEIARITGLPLGTIKSRIRLALEKLRQSMS